MSKNDGGPAFPVQPLGTDGLPCDEGAPGMTLRDYVAADLYARMLLRDMEDQGPLTTEEWGRRLYDIAKAAHNAAYAFVRERDET